MKTIYKNYFRKQDNTDPILKVLKSIPIFEGLSSKDLKKIFQLTHERIYKKDENIFKKHAPAEGMYVILEGVIEINDPESGNIFANLEKGDFFGELALLDDKPRSASAIATTPAKLFGFFRTDLLTLIERAPAIGNEVLLNLARVLGERLRRTNKELAKSPE